MYILSVYIRPALTKFDRVFMVLHLVARTQLARENSRVKVLLINGYVPTLEFCALSILSPFTLMLQIN